jgi:hypothetical protein
VLVGSVEETVQRPAFELPNEVLRHRADQVRPDANADPVDCPIVALLERIPASHAGGGDQKLDEIWLISGLGDLA